MVTRWTTLGQKLSQLGNLGTFLLKSEQQSDQIFRATEKHFLIFKIWNSNKLLTELKVFWFFLVCQWFSTRAQTLWEEFQTQIFSLNSRELLPRRVISLSVSLCSPTQMHSHAQELQEEFVTNNRFALCWCPLDHDTIWSRQCLLWGCSIFKSSVITFLSLTPDGQLAAKRCSCEWEVDASACRAEGCVAVVGAEWLPVWWKGLPRVRRCVEKGGFQIVWERLWLPSARPGHYITESLLSSPWEWLTA